MAADQQNPTIFRGVTAALLALTAALTVALGTSPVLAQAPAPSPRALPAAAPPPPLKLDTVSARRGDIEQTVEAAGKLQLHKWADTYAQIGGQVKEVKVAIGD